MTEIKSYLRLLNNYYSSRSKTGHKEHLLFVEGSSDKKFFGDLFSKLKNFKIDKQNIYFDFSINHGDDWICNFGNPYRHQGENTFSSAQGLYKNYDFVIAATYEDNLPIEDCNIDCFGFVDKDFAEKKDFQGEPLTFYAPRKLAQTDCHDLETTICYEYLPLLYKKHLIHHPAESCEYVCDLIAQILYFTYCQGVLESNSIAYSEFHLKNETNSNFRKAEKWDLIKNIYGDVLNFDFVKYLDDIKKRKNNFVVAAFVEKCKKDIKRIGQEKLKKHVSDWLSNGKKSSLLKLVFDFTNGHLLSMNLGSYLANYFNLSWTNKERELRERLLEILIEDSKAHDSYLNISPLKEYLQYRMHFNTL